MEKLKTVDIKGKPYVEVNERIRFFNENYPNGSIVTEIVNHDAGVILMRATIYPDVEKPERRFVAHSYEKEGSSFINKTSYIENCETSVVGRALGMMGIGVDTSIASAEEVVNAVNNQEQKQPVKITKKEAVDKLIATAEANGYGADEVEAVYCWEVGDQGADIMDISKVVYDKLMQRYSKPKGA